MGEQRDGVSAAPQTPDDGVTVAVQSTTDPLDIPLPADVHVSGGVFRKGVSLRTFVTAAASWKADADKAFTDRIKTMKNFREGLR